MADKANVCVYNHHFFLGKMLSLHLTATEKSGFNGFMIMFLCWTITNINHLCSVFDTVEYNNLNESLSVSHFADRFLTFMSANAQFINIERKNRQNTNIRRRCL